MRSCADGRWMKLVSSSIERVETKNSPESSLTQENEGLVVIGQEFVDERILRDFRRPAFVVRKQSKWFELYPIPRDQRATHTTGGINTFTWGSIGSVSNNKGTVDEFLKFFLKGIVFWSFFL